MVKVRELQNKAKREKAKYIQEQVEERQRNYEAQKARDLEEAKRLVFLQQAGKFKLNTVSNIMSDSEIGYNLDQLNKEVMSA